MLKVYGRGFITGGNLAGGKAKTNLQQDAEHDDAAVDADETASLADGPAQAQQRSDESEDPNDDEPY